MALEILSQIEIVPVVASTVISFLLGWLYYSPAVAGKTWMKLQKIDPKKAKGMKKGMGKMMVGVLISLFVAASTISILVNVIGVTTVLGGAALGFGLWLGLIASTMAMNYMHKKGAGLFSIETTYVALSFVIMGAVIVAF